jgi:CDP-glucose 4,6-dehydratase
VEGMVGETLNRPDGLDVAGRRVLITGHTGFKGAWLAEWLLARGARVTGIALPPESPESLFDALELGQRLDHVVCDIREPDELARAVRAADPELVFHLAAQALVRRSYREPLATWQTNVNGTLNLLEALRALNRRVVVIAVTTDKVYRNREWEFPYRETDELGGHDPYSASKAGCELAVASWRASFGSSDGVAVVTARAGNVIGPGDVSEDRIVPDCYRAWARGEPVLVRQPTSTRPWQHVLEPLSGYLALANHVSNEGAGIGTCNFGPGPDGDRTVAELVGALAALDTARRWSTKSAPGPHEARALSLAIDRARRVLGWTPRLGFHQAVEWTDDGCRGARGGLRGALERQIADYEALHGAVSGKMGS